MNNAKVYFTKAISPETVVAMFRILGKNLPGKVAVKVHSGEAGNQNFLRPAFLQPMVEYVHGTVVECNTAYPGERNSTEKHLKTIEAHGWNRLFRLDLMDETGPDAELSIPNGKILQKNFVGKNLLNYDSLLVLSHFKGHPKGGYGGALKQLSIGCASQQGKCRIHSGGAFDEQSLAWANHASQDVFCEAMADAAESVVNHFGANIAYVSMMCNLSVDCDCIAQAEPPCMKDIGTLSSLDPVALDQACIDLIYKSNDPGRGHFLERVESRHGTHTIDAAAALGFGTKEYELVVLD